MATAPQKKAHVKWTPTEETILVDTLIAQKELGLQSENGWKPTVWTTVAAVLRENFPDGATKGVKQIRSRWQRIKAQFHIVQTLRRQSGFGWSEGIQMVTAPSHVWDSYLTAHPKAKPFRKRPFPLYDRLSMIIDGTVANGARAVYTNDVKRLNMGTQNPLPQQEADESSSGEEGEESNSTMPQKHGLSGTSTPVSAHPPPIKRQRRQVTGAEAMLTMSNAMASLALAIKARPAAQSAATPGKSAPRTLAIHQLEEEGSLSNIDKADMALIFENSDHAVDTYLAFRDEAVRLKWLQQKLELAK